MTTKEALERLAKGARFIQDSYGWHIVRKPDKNGNHHHMPIKANVARALKAYGHAPEQK